MSFATEHSSVEPSIRNGFATQPDDVNIELHERLDENQLELLYEIFAMQPGKRFDAETLKPLLEVAIKVPIPDNEFNVMFMRMNGKRDGLVTWDEFISYLILCFEQKDVKAEFDTLANPISTPPSIIRSNHRYTINRIIYCPTVRPDRTISWHDGSLMTCSRDGTINYWSLDVQYERTVKSSCPNLKVAQTWVTDMVALPDVSVVCTSSTERDLRFYDTSARKFELRVIFTSIECAIYTMNYWFSDNPNEESKLVMGDMCGNLYVIYIESVARGPFRSQLGMPLLEVPFDQVIKGLVGGFRVTFMPKQHSNAVVQILYYQRFNCIFCCSECQRVGLLMRDLGKNKENYVYNIQSGVWSFDITESGQLLASGSPDCLVRLWNPFVPSHPVSVLYGHRAPICAVIFQDSGKLLYSLAQDKSIRVWDVAKQACMQNYLGIPQELGEHSDMTTLYNPASRQLVIGSTMMAVVPLNPQQSGEHTDGNTHTAGVSVVLYNPLYKVIVSCGLDSYIVVWNPFDGRRMMVIKEAHTKSVHAEVIPIEITAAAFDPGYQRLITGAHDGSLKIWNFNTGTCLRNMKIAKNCEVKCIIWVTNRILVMGWNRRVTEFGDIADLVGSEGQFSKNWDLRHMEDISACAVTVPQTIVTGTYDGEVIMWRLETGQAYKQFNVADPTARIKIQYKKVKKKPAEVKRTESSSKRAIARAKGKSVTMEGDALKKHPSGGDDAPEALRMAMARRISASPRASSPSMRMQLRQRRVSTVVMPEACMPLRRLAVHSMIFLNSRPMDPQIGTLLIALENGAIQVWSHHVLGGFITSFSAIHKAGDYVICMATDAKNEFLFTGHSVGYIKTWLMINYHVPFDGRISMPYYRIMFPFLWGDFLMGRALRIARSQPMPMLLNSFKAHLVTISSLVYIDETEMLISSSVDYTVRMWTLGGRYLQTIGTFKPWRYVSPDPNQRANFEHTIPPDLWRLGSSTTCRVLRGGATARKMTFKQMHAKAMKEFTHVDETKIYGQSLAEPILGHHYKPSVRTTHFHEVKFDTAFPYIPVYQHLIMPPPQNVAITIKSNYDDEDVLKKAKPSK